jgi:Phosphodiester glycosidase
MKWKVLAVSLAAATHVVQAQTIQVPTVTAVVSTLSASAATRDGFTRLRLSLTSNEVSANENARLAGIALCTTAMCYESGAPSSVTVSSTVSGTSATVAELEVPYSDIVNVRFKSSAGQGFLQGSIVLPEPLKLEKGFKGGDVLVVIQRQGAGYVPVAAASNYVQPEGTSFFYNPKFATTVKLPYGVSLSIPAGATAAPHVFVAGVHDTGDEYPLVDIYPPVQLSKPATVQLPAIARAASATLSNQAPPSPRPQAVQPGGTLASQTQTQAARASSPMSIEINATGTVPRRPQAAQSSKQSSTTTTNDVLAADADTAAACNQYGWCNCADQLAYPQNQQIIANGLTATGTSYLNWCTTIAPHVHITVTNMADSRERFTVKHSPKVGASAPPSYLPPRLPLVRITSWSPNTQVMTNGFYWQGDEGTSSGQTGLADAHVRNFGTGLGDNLAAGGACDDYPTPPYATCINFAPHGNKRVMVMPSTGTGWSWLDNGGAGPVASTSWSYVSSSTSVVKNGVCSTDTTFNRWSAVGNTSGGRLIFMSSTTDSQTSAKELCAVFKAMGVNNAIRLDGGPSAAMAVDGALKNPLGGLFFIKYGSMRYIAYGLKVSYQGW